MNENDDIRDVDLAFFEPIIPNVVAKKLAVNGRIEPLSYSSLSWVDISVWASGRQLQDST